MIHSPSAHRARARAACPCVPPGPAAAGVRLHRPQPSKATPPRSQAPSGRGLSATARTVPIMAIARLPSIVIDCPDPGALARFYGAMLDRKADVPAGWAEVRAGYGQCICFQQVQDYTAPRWPAQQVPQQMHLDVKVDDLARWSSCFTRLFRLVGGPYPLQTPADEPDQTTQRARLWQAGSSGGESIRSSRRIQLE